MKRKIHLDILPQPNDTTCGPTCLHAIYQYYGDDISLQQVIDEVRQLREGGTFAVLLACHALKRGYQATIYTYNMQVFDPTWFDLSEDKILEKLKDQYFHKEKDKVKLSTKSYIEYLSLGGRLELSDLKSSLIHRYIKQSTPIITGLSATFLYRTPREYGPKSDYDDIRGEPSGHFVVIFGYDKLRRKLLIADPLHPNPISSDHIYEVDKDRLITSILLGVLTYDANLLIIQPPSAQRGES